MQLDLTLKTGNSEDNDWAIHFLVPLLAVEGFILIATFVCIYALQTKKIVLQIVKNEKN